MNKFSKFLNRFGIDKGFGNVVGGNIIASMIVGVFGLFLASLLSTEEYGLFGYYLALATLFGTISVFGLRHTVITYLAKGDEKILPQANFVVLISNIIVIGIMYLWIEHLPTILLLGAMSFFSMSRAEDLGRSNFKKFSYYIIAQRLMIIPLSLSLFFLIGIDGIILGLAISSIIFSFNFFRTFKNFDFDFTSIKKKFSFITHVYSQDVIPIIANNIDKLIIANFFGFVILGEYQLGFQILILLSVLPISTMQFLLPSKASAIQEKKIEKTILIFAVCISILVIFLIPIIIPIFLPHFENSIESAQIMSLGVIPWTIISIFDSKFIRQEKTKLVLIGATIRISTLLILLILLGEQLGIIGFALAVLFSLIAHCLTISFFYKFKFAKEIY